MKKEERKSMLAGLRLACCYMWNCKKSETLGVSDKLLSFALGKDNNNEKIKREIRRILKQFKPYQFYKELAEILDQNEYAEKVVSSYWIGEPFFFPSFFHNYTILLPWKNGHLNDLGLSALNRCFIHVGLVEEINKKEVKLKYRPLVLEKNKLIFDKLTTTEKINNFLNLKLEKKNFVTLHYNSVAEKIPLLLAKKLSENSKKALKVFNKSR